MRFGCTQHKVKPAAWMLEGGGAFPLTPGVKSRLPAIVSLMVQAETRNAEDGLYRTNACKHFLAARASACEPDLLGSIPGCAIFHAHGDHGQVTSLVCPTGFPFLKCPLAGLQGRGNSGRKSAVSLLPAVVTEQRSGHRK